MVTVKRLLFRRVVFTDWDVVLYGRLLTARQWVAVLVNVLNRDRPFLNFWRDVLFVNVDHVLRTFCHLAVSWVGLLVHPDEVVTIERLLFRRVVFTDWDIVLYGRLLTARQWVAVLVNVLNRDRPFLNFWRDVLFVNVDHVLRTFCHLAVSWVGLLVHPDEVVTIEALFFRRVLFTDWDVILDRGGIFQYLAVRRHVLHIHRTLLNYRFWILIVDVDDVLGAFRHLAISWVRCLIHPDEVVTIESLFFRRVLVTDRNVVLHSRLLTAWQRVAILVNVLNRDRPFLNFWRDVLFVDVNDVLRAFRYHTRGWVRRLVHPNEVVTIEALFFRLVLFTNWGIVLNARHVF